MNPIQAASVAARAAHRQVRGEAATYTRDGVGVAVTVIRGITNWDSDEAYPGNRVGNKSQDVLIERSALPYEPQRGDTITLDGIIYRVMPYGQDNQVWQYHDRDRTVLRIHTKERT